MKNILFFLWRLLSGSGKLIPYVDACIAQIEKAKGKVLAVPDLPESENERLKATYPAILSLTKINDEYFLNTLGKIERSLLYLRSAILLFRNVSGYGISDSKLIVLIQARYMKLTGKK